MSECSMGVTVGGLLLLALGWIAAELMLMRMWKGATQGEKGAEKADAEELS